MLKSKQTLFYRTLAGVFCLNIGFFSAFGHAVVVRFPVFPDPVPLGRPKVDIQNLPKSIRILNPSLGSYFHSSAIEFDVAADGSVKRSKTYSIDYLSDAMRVPTKDACEAMLGSAARNQALGQIFLDTMLAGTSHRRIDAQALGEMAARKYIDPNQLDFYKQSAEGAHPDGYVFLESLSWMTAAQAKETFAGVIPWERVAELDSPYDSVPMEELKAMVDQGNDKIKVRIRRATLRIALGVVYHNHWMLGRTQLPWEQEALAKGKRPPYDSDDLFMFEFGRASQIPGLENEALQLGGIAALYTAYYSQLLAKRGEMIDLNKVKIYYHALKPSHSAMYMRWLGAKVLTGFDDPNDSVLQVDAGTMIDRTFEKSGMFRDYVAAMPAGQKFEPGWFVRSNRSAVSHRFYTFVWQMGEQDLTPTGPILIVPSKKQSDRVTELRVKSSNDEATLRKFAQAEATRPEQTILSPKSVMHDNSLPFLPAELKNSHDVFVSGFNTNFVLGDDKYFLQLALGLSKEFNYDQLGEGKHLFVSKTREFAKQAQVLGFKVWEFTGADHMVRYAVSVSWQEMKALRERFPVEWKNVQQNSHMGDGRSRTWFSLVNLDGFI